MKYHADCDDCDYHESYVLWGERNLKANRHEREHNHTVTREPETPEGEQLMSDGGASTCSNCGAVLPKEIDPGTGVYCDECGHGQHVTDGGQNVEEEDAAGVVDDIRDFIHDARSRGMEIDRVVVPGDDWDDVKAAGVRSEGDSGLPQTSIDEVRVTYDGMITRPRAIQHITGATVTDANDAEGGEQRDCGVGAAGGLVCQNFAAHPGEEPKMQPGPFDGVMCPECGRMAGGGPPLDIPYVDGEARGPTDESEEVLSQ